jgi:BirA family biotin operon repressor/biotin-[acetyl-CoA-carboxylase] ligase
VRAVPRRRKVAGILVEREHIDGRDLLLIGVGVNIGDEQRAPVDPGEHTRTAHPERIDLQELLGTTLDRQGPVVIDRPGLIAGLVAAFADRLGALDGDGAQLLAAYRARCETIGRDVDLDLPDGTSLQGRAIDIDEDGHLVLDVDGARHVVVAATVR